MSASPQSPLKHARFLVHRDYVRLDELEGMTITMLNCLHAAGLYWSWEVAILCPRCLRKIDGIGATSVTRLLAGLQVLGFSPATSCARGYEACLGALRRITWDVKEQSRDVEDWLGLLRTQLGQMRELARLCENINRSLAATLESFETSSGAREVLQMVTTFMVRHGRNGTVPEEVTHG